jgi:hypothetical protein
MIMMMPKHPQRSPSPWPRALLSLAAAALAALLLLTPAWGQGRDELQGSLAQAMRSYDELEFSEAERRLEDAIKLAERLGLDQDPVVADLHIFLGVVRFTVSGEEATERAFRAGLTINPDANISPDYKTPDLDVILERVRASIPRGVGTPDPTPVVGREIEHTPIQTANAGQPIIFEATVPPTVPLYRMQLNYRRYGDREYSILDMQPVNPTTFRVILPGDEVYTSNLDYFIEVLDRTGGILVATGGPLSPLNVIVFGGDKFKGGGKKNKKDPDPDPTPSGDRQYVFLQVSGGGGFGLATGTPDVMKQLEINPGIAPAPFHVIGELGFMLTQSLHLSGFYRAQIVEPENLFGAKLKWWFDSDSDWMAYTGVGGGYGRVRHTVDLRPAAEFVDTTREGPFHGGVGFGFGYKIGANVMFVIDFYTLILFPDISAHLDGNLGFRFSL